MMDPLFRTANVGSVPDAHPEVGWEQPRNVGRGRRSPLATLVKEKAKEAAAALIPCRYAPLPGRRSRAR